MHKMKFRLTPVVALLLLAPLIGEVLFGSIPLSRVVPGFLAVIGLYGGGALLIRELVRRRGLPSYWLPILGSAFGIFWEGLVLQSLFNPHYPGLDFLGWYGRWAGVGWIWAIFILAYHAVFSITIPILVTELLFPAVARKPWLSKRGLIITASVFALNAVVLAVFLGGVFSPTHTNPSAWVALGAAIVIAAIVAIACKVRPAAAKASSGKAPKPGVVRTLAFLGAFAWFAVRIFLVDPTYPVWIPLAGDTVVLSVVALAVWRWTRLKSNWTQLHTFAVAAGPLPMSWLFGFIIVAVSSGIPAIDLLAHLAFGVLMFIGLARLRRRIKAA